MEASEDKYREQRVEVYGVFLSQATEEVDGTIASFHEAGKYGNCMLQLEALIYVRSGFLGNVFKVVVLDLDYFLKFLFVWELDFIVGFLWEYGGF